MFNLLFQHLLRGTEEYDETDICTWMGCFMSCIAYNGGMAKRRSGNKHLSRVWYVLKIKYNN
jgi:hypothetical protein